MQVRAVGEGLVVVDCSRVLGIVGNLANKSNNIH